MQSIGVDIGGTSIKFGIVNTDSGTISKSFSKNTPLGVDAVVTAIAEGVSELAISTAAIGVGVPGAMNVDRSLVRYPPNLKGWEVVPLRALLQKALPEFSIELDNDAKVATLAEATLGSGKGLSHFLLVTLGTGVGGGLWMTEGSYSGIVRGAGGGAGEFGHMSIDFRGPECSCGSRGCIEAYLGNANLSSRTEKKLEEDPNIQSSLRSTAITPLEIARAMDAGDAFARAVFMEAGELLGVALANVANLLDIHYFVIGGGVAEAGGVLFDAARASLRRSVLKNLRDVVEIRAAKFGSNSGVVGAGLLTAQLNR
jgi:glucokinase